MVCEVSANRERSLFFGENVFASLPAQFSRLLPRLPTASAGQRVPMQPWRQTNSSSLLLLPAATHAKEPCVKKKKKAFSAGSEFFLLKLRWIEKPYLVQWDLISVCVLLERWEVTIGPCWSSVLDLSNLDKKKEPANGFPSSDGDSVQKMCCS